MSQPSAFTPCVDVEVLIDRQIVEQRIRQLAAQLAADYRDAAPCFIGILNGAVQFMMELLCCMPEEILERLQYDFVDVSSYDGATSRGEVTVLKQCTLDLCGRDVLVIDGIVDTGLTLRHVLSMVQAKNPRSLKVCTLVDKPARRKHEVQIDYRGFTVEDVFVVGCGMDYAQQYRALRYIGKLE